MCGAHSTGRPILCLHTCCLCRVVCVVVIMGVLTYLFVDPALCYMAERYVRSEHIQHRDNEVTVGSRHSWECQLPVNISMWVASTYVIVSLPSVVFSIIWEYWPFETLFVAFNLHLKCLVGTVLFFVFIDQGKWSIYSLSWTQNSRLPPPSRLVKLNTFT